MQPKNAHALNNTWKRQDTTQDLIVWFSGVMPNPSHAWTVRVADSKGYLGDYDATLQGNRFVIDTGQFADFPVGHYVLEIWETYSKDGKAETGIYPNPDSFVTFDINANVVDDDLVKAFDLDEVLGKAAARANKAIVVDGTETLPAGSQAAVESRYDGERVHFAFKLPKGADGKDGTDGATPQIGSNGNWVIAGHDTGKTSVGRQGDKGDPPTLRVGSVTKVAPGGNPTASVSGSNGDYSLNLGIPEGQQGAKGDGFTDYGNITKSGDLNDYKRTGVADIQAVMANKPAGYEWNWGVLKVFAPDNGSHHIVQEWYPSGTSDGTMFFRYYTVSGASGKWNAWQKIGGVNDGWLDYIVGALGTNHNLVTTTNKIKWNATLGQVSEPADGTTRFTFTDSTVRGLWASRNVGPVKTGKKYIFRCKIRANEPMDSLVAGNSSAIFDKTTITTDWQDLEVIFDSTKGFNIYAKGNSGDWFEIKDQVLIEAGGVATTNLMTFSDQTLTVNQSFPMWSGMPVTGVLSPGHYFASYRYDTSGDRTNTTRIRITTSDTKYDASAKWGGYPVVGNPAYLEFDVPDDGHSYMAWLYTTDYQVSATVPMHYTDGYIGKLSDQVGGVSNLALYSNEGMGNNSTFDEHTGVYKISIPANTGGDNYDLWYFWPGKIKSGHRYRVAFDVMGNGNSFGVTFRMIDPIWKIDTVFEKHPVGLEWETITYDYTATYDDNRYGFWCEPAKDGSKEAWIKVRNWSIVALD